MDIGFENRYYSTDKMISEYIRRVLSRRLNIFGGVSAAVTLVMLAITLQERDYIYAAIFGVCLCIIVFSLLLSPLLMMRQMKESARRIHNGKDFEAVFRFGENISATEGALSLTIEYSQIIKIYDLKYSYVLMFGRRNGLILKPDSFTIGDFDSFKTFIKEKCVNLKQPG